MKDKTPSGTNEIIGETLQKARRPRTEAGAEDGGMRGTRNIKTEERQEAGKGREEGEGQDRSNEEARQEESRGKVMAG